MCLTYYVPFGEHQCQGNWQPSMLGAFCTFLTTKCRYELVFEETSVVDFGWMGVVLQETGLMNQILLLILVNTFS